MESIWYNRYMNTQDATTIRVSKKTRDFIMRVCNLRGQTADEFTAELMSEYASDMDDDYAVKLLKEVRSEYGLTAVRKH